MTKLLCALVLFASSSTWAATTTATTPNPWNPCRPTQISHAPTLATPAKVCVNELGVHASWSCLRGTAWVPQRAVVRWDAATPAMRSDFDTWTKTSTDPADLRALNAKYATGNPYTDPALTAVPAAGGYCWTP